MLRIAFSENIKVKIMFVYNHFRQKTRHETSNAQTLNIRARHNNYFIQISWLLKELYKK